MYVPTSTYLGTRTSDLNHVNGNDTTCRTHPHYRDGDNDCSNWRNRSHARKPIIRILAICHSRRSPTRIVCQSTRFYLRTSTMLRSIVKSPIDKNKDEFSFVPVSDKASKESILTNPLSTVALKGQWKITNHTMQLHMVTTKAITTRGFRSLTILQVCTHMLIGQGRPRRYHDPQLHICRILRRRNWRVCTRMGRQILWR